MVSGCKPFSSQYNDSHKIAKIRRWIVYRTHMRSHKGPDKRYWLMFLYLQFRDAMNSLKALLPQGWWHVRGYSSFRSVYACKHIVPHDVPPVSVSDRHGWCVWCCVAVQLISQSSKEDCKSWCSHSPNLCITFARFCLSLCLFCLFFTLSLSTLHSSSSLLTWPDGLYTPSFLFIFTCNFSFLLPFLSFLLSFPVLLLAHLSFGCLGKLSLLS